MLLSLSGFLFENSTGGLSLSNHEFLRLAKSAGYGGVELRQSQIAVSSTAAERKQLLTQVGACGLVVTCYAPRTLPPDLVQHDRNEALQRCLELCQDLHCPLLKIRGSPEWLVEACARAGESGVVLATNNHIGTSTETVRGTRHLLAAVNMASFKLLYDAMHLSLGSEPYLDCIAEFAPRTANILIQSVRPAQDGEAAVIEHAKRRWTKALPDETPTIQWPNVLSAFRSAGYNGPITVIENNWPVEQRCEVAIRCAKLVHDWWRSPAVAAAPATRVPSPAIRNQPFAL